MIAHTIRATLVARRASSCTIQAARLRPEAKACGLGTSATRALASSGPTPGISAERTLTTLARWQAVMRRFHLQDLALEQHQLLGQSQDVGLG
jgi:hypothetical protein